VEVVPAVNPDSRIPQAKCCTSFIDLKCVQSEAGYMCDGYVVVL
jgi:hypothetical protein